MVFLYSFAVNEDSSSDEETVYIKTPAKVSIHIIHHVHVFIVAFLCCQKKNPLLRPIDPLPPRPKGDSKAEWAVKNMYYNPGTVCYIWLESSMI